MKKQPITGVLSDETKTSDYAKPRLADVPTDWKTILEDALSHIDWKLRHCGCQHYIFVSHAGVETNIEFWHDRIKITNHEVFGHSDNYADYVDFGYVIFYLKDVDIKKKDDGFLSFVGKNDNGLFMTLRKISDEYKA